MFWGDGFFMILGIGIVSIFIKNISKDVEFALPCSVPFRDLFPHTFTFYFGKTHKCQKPIFPFSSKNQSEQLLPNQALER